MNAPKFTPCVDFPGYEVSDDGRVRSTSNWHGTAARITPTKRRAMREGLNRYWEARRHG